MGIGAGALGACFRLVTPGAPTSTPEAASPDPANGIARFGCDPIAFAVCNWERGGAPRARRDPEDAHPSCRT
eukprot:5625917-Alexandrium_andersonii.AAC.1